MIERDKDLINRLSIAALAFIFIFIVQGWSVPEDAAAARNLRKDKAPDFELKDLKGGKFKLSAQEKRPVLLVFTTIWCPICREKIPQLKEIYAAYAKKGLVMVNIDIQEPREKVSRFAARYKLPYRVLLDETAEVAERYGVYGVPTMVLIDREGMIVCRQCPYVEQPLDELFKLKK